MTATVAAPLWLNIARRYLGLREVPGKQHNPTIVEWFAGLFKDDETPWCGAFVAGVCRAAGLPVVKNFAGARNWLDFGVPLPRPVPGAVVVFWRGKKSGWSGHVGFVVGRDKAGNLMVLGGNQGDMVSIKPFSRDRVLGYRWPANTKLPANDNLPLLESNGKLSTNEA
jgi:uncharacterized protein (TIGR02594 family)